MSKNKNKRKGKKKLLNRSVLVALSLFVILVLFSVSGSVACRSYNEVARNSESVFRDFTAVRVESINDDGSYSLVTGENVDKDDIKGYARVFDGLGDWYKAEDGVVILETPNYISLVIFAPFVVIGLLGIGVLLYYLKVGFLNRKVFIACLIVYMVSSVVNIQCMVAWLFR